MPISDVTYRHERFSNLAHDSFREVQSQAELLSHFLDCTDGVILVTRHRPLSELMPNVNVLIRLAHNCVFSFIDERRSFFLYKCVEDSVLYKSLEFLNWLQTLLKVTDSSDVLTVEDFLRKFYLGKSCECAFYPILYFRNGQFHFYITELSLLCADHVRVFTESTTIAIPSNAARLCSEQSCLKFLSSLSCHGLQPNSESSWCSHWKL